MWGSAKVPSVGQLQASITPHIVLARSHRTSRMGADNTANGVPVCTEIVLATSNHILRPIPQAKNTANNDQER